MDPQLIELIGAGSPGDEVAVIVRLNDGASPPAALRIVARFGAIATGRALRGQLAAIHADRGVASLKAPRTYAGEPADGDSRDEPGVSEADPDPVDTDRRRPSDLAETGKGAIVAVIDWGCDFAHPDFRTERGTRLLALWDQRASGSAALYGYGRIHQRSAIDRALTAADPFAALGYTPSADAQPMHGTHVLGIAAGNGRAGGPAGVAPEADIVFVHLGPGVGDLGSSVDLLEAIHFVTTVAGTRPLAINMSIGRHAGPHDGSLLVEQAIDWLIGARPGTAVVQSAGNYHARDIHMAGRLREARTARLPFHVVRRDDSPVTVELWYKTTDTFAARATGPGGETAVADRDARAVLRGRDGTEYGTLYHRGFDPNNHDHLIQLTLRGAAPAGEWGIEITGLDVVDGRWHAWIERNAACPSCQAQFLADHADPAVTTGSICNAQRTIAVGAYDAHDPDHSLARFSSAGPTRDGRPKPLLVAPGVRILSVRSRRDAVLPPGYVRMSGTSMAAPVVTGTIALMFEVLGAVPATQVRRALFAALAPAPGSDLRWGYGLLDIARAVANARAVKEGRALGAPGLDTRPGHEEESMPQETDVPGTPRPPDYQLWTYGRDQSLPTNVDKVLGSLTEQQLEAALAPAPPPVVAVASREAESDPAGAHDPTLALAQALDPAFRGMAVIGWPGRRLGDDLASGDLIVRHDAGRALGAMVITDPRLERRPGGMVVEILGGRDSHQRVAGPDGLLLRDVAVVRPRRAADESDPEPAAHPTIRRGSRGPAVNEAQSRLNIVSTRRAAGNAGLGLDHCPLVVDGVFGPATGAATNHFQRLAFAGQPSEWDSVIGPKTWTALIAASADDPQPVIAPPPEVPPPLPPDLPPSLPPDGPPAIIPVAYEPKVVPIIVLPGVMGTRLEFPGHFGAGWDPDSVPSMLYWAKMDPEKKLILLNPKVTEARVKFDKDKPNADRGWSGISQDFYLDLLKALEARFNPHGPLDDRIDLLSIRSPVYAMGYDWRSSNKDSARRLAKFIPHVLRQQSRRADKVILVTHSMGGLVARKALQSTEGLEDMVLGVIHAVQPAVGAVAAARRFRTSFSAVIDGTLGKGGDPSDAEVAAVEREAQMAEGAAVKGYVMPRVMQAIFNDGSGAPNPVYYGRMMAGMRGPNELLPSNAATDASPDWWPDASGSSQDVYGLYRHEFPDGPPPFRTKVPGQPIAGVVNAALPRDDKRALGRRIEQAAAFHAELKSYYHPKTGVVYGNGLLTDTHFTQNGQTNGGDGTVPAFSASCPDLPNPLFRAKVDGAEHANCFNNTIFLDHVLNGVATIQSFATQGTPVGARTVPT